MVVAEQFRRACGFEVVIVISSVALIVVDFHEDEEKDTAEMGNGDKMESSGQT